MNACRLGFDYAVPVGRGEQHMVEVVHWNPRRPVLHRKLKIGRRFDNFGDLLGPIIVDELLARRGLSNSKGTGGPRLLSVGSILRLAQDGDVVWGTGMNGKSLDGPFPAGRLDVRAVRGPKTRDYLASVGIPAPEVFGDPGLLVGELWDRDELARSRPARGVSFVPNFHDLPRYSGRSDLIDPLGEVWGVIGDIAASEFVVATSLHGIVVAESLGIPARLVTPGREPDFKYADYYRATGRPDHRAASTIYEAIRLGGEPAPSWDPQPLLNAFPYDLWESGGSTGAS